MLNVIKIDLYKLFRSTSFYVIGIVITALAAISSYFEANDSVNSYTYYLEHINSEYPASMMSSSIFYNLLATMGTVAIYLCIFAMLFICAEFSNGTMKNIASKGFPRIFTYMSKLVSSIIATIIYFSFTIFVSLIIPFFIVGDKIPHYYTLPTKFFSNFTFTILSTLALLSIAIFIAFLVRKSGASIGTYVGITMLESILLPILSSFFKNKFNWKDFSLLSYTPNGILAEASRISHNVINIPGATYTYDMLKVTSDVITRWICVISICFIVFTAFGVYLFKKRDI